MSATTKALPPLILASTSKYRAALLARLKVPFRVIDPELDEDALKSSIPSPSALAQSLAFEKANRVMRNAPHSVVLGSDQVVVHGGVVLGKPGDQKRAKEQLSRLQGSMHELITAVCLLYETDRLEFIEITQVKMRALDTEEIARYVEEDTPIDCAGAYKIESLGISLFDEVKGTDPTAIEGLPLLGVSRLLRQTGFRVP